MDNIDYMQFVFAFAFVITLIWAMASIVKKLGLDKKIRGVSGGKERLQLLEVLYLDPKRKVTLIRADDREYLLMVGPDSAQVIDTLGVRDAV